MFALTPITSPSPLRYEQHLSSPQRLMFGARYQVGNTTDLETVNPVILFFKHYLSLPEIMKQVPKHDKVAVDTIVQGYIRYLQQSSSPLIPDYRPDTSLERLIEEQDISTPNRLPEAIQTLEKLSNQERVFSRYQQAGNFLGRQLNTNNNIFPYSSESGEGIQTLFKDIKNTSTSDPRFIKLISKFNAFLSQGLEMEINLENGRLEELAKSSEPTLFIANHPNSPSDLLRSFAFIKALYDAYHSETSRESTPLMKYVIVQEFIEALPESLREAFLKTQAVPVDASLYPTKQRSQNNVAMGPIIDGFAEGQHNILIFPEGARRKYQADLSMSERFQYGIGKLVLSALSKHEKIRVVSLGMDKNNSLYIGKPRYIHKNEAGFIETNAGNLSLGPIHSGKDSRFLKKLAQTEEDSFLRIPYADGYLHIPDTNAVDSKQKNKLFSRVIAGLLQQDLEISIRKAEEMT